MIDFRPWSPPAILWLCAARSALACLRFWARYCGLSAPTRADRTIIPFPQDAAAPVRAGAPAGQLLRFTRAPVTARTR